MTDADRDTNRKMSSVRSKVEHPFLTVKHLWGFTKARYRGLAKNANRAFAMLALINLTKWRNPSWDRYVQRKLDYRDIPYFYLQSKLYSDETSIRFKDSM